MLKNENQLVFNIVVRATNENSLFRHSLETFPNCLLSYSLRKFSGRDANDYPMMWSVNERVVIFRHGVLSAEYYPLFVFLAQAPPSRHRHPAAPQVEPGGLFDFFFGSGWRAVAIPEPVIRCEIIRREIVAGKHSLRPIARRDRRAAARAVGRDFDPVFRVSHIAEGEYISDFGT